MLVCNVSLRPARGAISATIAEAGTAADVTTVGTVFAGLVDDPASALDTLDGYLGEIMLEAASASDTVDLAGATYAVAVDEMVTAASVEDATVSGAVAATSAMIAGPWPVFVNPGTSREANVLGTQVNL